MSGCGPYPGQFPFPPANAMAMSAFHSSDTDIRWDDPSTLDTGPSQAISSPTTTAVVEVICISTPTVETYAAGSFQVINSPIPPGETVEIDGLILTAADGLPSTLDEFDGSSIDPSVVATNLLAAVNLGSPGTWQVVQGTVSGTLISLTAVSPGEAGNYITLVSTSSLIIPSAGMLSGGYDLATLTIGGTLLSAVLGPRTSGLRDFSTTDTLDSLVGAINDPLNGLSSLVRAERAGDCVRVLSVREGSIGNGIPISSASSALILSGAVTSGGTGVPCSPGQTNSDWDIVGVNVYRSDTGERGPYFRVNQVPTQALFYRDRTDIVGRSNEIVAWNGGWIFKGDSPNNKGWRLQTNYRRVVKRVGNAIPADSPSDVEVTVDGKIWPARDVFGPTGEIDLTTERVWDPAAEVYVDPPIPTETSEVLVSYYYQRTNKLVNTLDDRWKVFYRLTTIAMDPFGTSPSGFVESPLGHSPPISPMESEQLDYIWREAIRRNRWILEQGGERVKVFIRRATGVPCRCVWDPRLEEYSQQPMNMCLSCYGTGFVGGYEGPFDIIVGPDDNERRVTQTANGRALEHTYEVWIGPTPMLSQRDFILKQNGERYSVGPVRRTQVRGRTLQQTFNIGYLSTSDIRYRVPVGALERLPWPQTRPTNPEDAPCIPADPYPLGCDPVTPMATEKESIPDSRELRGRTPVWQNIQYGGKGGR